MPANGSLVLLGESFSGPIAISLAAKYPGRIKGVVLCCTFARNPHPFCAPFKLLTTLIPIKQFPLSLACVALLGRYETVELRRAINAALSKVSAAVLRARLKAILSVDVSAKLANMSAPILYLRASEDRVVPRRAGDLIQGAQASVRLVQISGPHALLQAAPDESAQAIRAFLRSISVAT